VNKDVPYITQRVCVTRRLWRGETHADEWWGGRALSGWGRPTDRSLSHFR